MKNGKRKEKRVCVRERQRVREIQRQRDSDREIIW